MGGITLAELLARGNIDVFHRRSVPNPEAGGESTLWSMSIGTPEGEVLIPRVSKDGRILSEQEAINHYEQTGEHLGKFSSVEAANKYADLHQQQEFWPLFMLNLGGQ